jgi:hypothetical protein
MVGKLAADLTLPRLRCRWHSHSGRTEHAGPHAPEAGARAARPAALGLTVEERDTIYRHAVQRVAHATEHFRHCVQHEPSRAADAAWAAADVLYSAAQVSNNGALRCAADAYDRAARAQFRRAVMR